MKYLLFLVAISAAACAHGTEAITATEQKAVAEPLFGTLYSNIHQPARLVIRDSQSWAQLWAQMVAPTDGLSSPPAVDFDKNEVVVAAMGERQRGGYAISINGIAQDASGTLHVDVASTIPASTCNASDVITTPLDAVLVPRTTETVQFSERAVVLSCD